MKKIQGIYFPDRDEHFAAHLTNGRAYQQAQFKSAMAHVKNPKIYVDIGAHVGLWILQAKAAGFDTIYGFEPNEEGYLCLKKNTNQMVNVFVYKCGLSNEEGRASLVEESETNTGACRVTEHDASKKPVYLYTLDERLSYLLTEKVKLDIQRNESLIKIDVEGMELECVQGAKKTIELLKPVIILEQRENMYAVEYLKEIGMTHHGAVNQDHILSWE